ncbi:hypothetical protein HY933_00440, partial [Candidatus Falkowbacteria bacterium]|nr:hypothetical protein [Candidatus Falkowbacteria bacterium]
MWSWLQKKRNSVIIALIAWVVALQALLFYPSPAYAVLPVAEVHKPAEKVELSVKEVIFSTIAGGVFNSINYFIKKIAYDTAVAIANAGNGQTPLIIQDFGGYINGAASETFGTLVDSLGDGIGLNLCQFPDVDLQLFVQIGLRDIYSQGPPKPKCDWKKFKNGWDPEQVGNRYKKKAQAFVKKYTDLKFNDMVSVKNSEFGITFDAIAKIDNEAFGSKELKEVERKASGFIKGVTEKVTGLTVTPPEHTVEELKSITAAKQTELSASQIVGVYSSNVPGMLSAAAGTFINTLASQLLKRVLTPSQGLVPINRKYDANYFGGGPADRKVAEAAFNFLLTPTITQQGAYNIAEEYASCPPNPGINHCVMDESLLTAINRAKTAKKPLTIAEAMTENLLHGDWPLISWRRKEDNTNKNCYRGAYCYSNLQKLRKARILPIGFEIAAAKANPDSRNAWKLQQVVEGFEDCDPTGVPTPAKPFCHLINPNWIIKMPPARCETKGVGPELVDENSAFRREECLDLSTCVEEDENGNCKNIYGYCLKEKNVWRIGGQSCEPQYATCTTFTDSEGQNASYLARTVDYGQCTADTVGCRAYSAEQSGSAWIPSVSQNV